MRLRLRIFACVMLALTNGTAWADIKIECAGHNRAINDYMEHEGRIAGSSAYFDGKPFKLTKTKTGYILTGPESQIWINRKAKSYVIYGPKGPRNPALERSRKVLGEGCDFSEVVPQP